MIDDFRGQSNETTPETSIALRWFFLEKSARSDCKKEETTSVISSQKSLIYKGFAYLK